MNFLGAVIGDSGDNHTNDANPGNRVPHPVNQVQDPVNRVPNPVNRVPDPVNHGPESEVNYQEPPISTRNPPLLHSGYIETRSYPDVTESPTSPFYTHPVQIPKVGVFIEKGGETIEHIQLCSGAKVQISKDQAHSHIMDLELMGSSEQIVKAQDLINAKILEYTDKQGADKEKLAGVKPTKMVKSKVIKQTSPEDFSFVKTLTASDVGKRLWLGDDFFPITDALLERYPNGDRVKGVQIKIFDLKNRKYYYAKYIQWASGGSGLCGDWLKYATIKEFKKGQRIEFRWTEEHGLTIRGVHEDLDDLEKICMLDFTLKTKVLVSTSLSLDWINRRMMSPVVDISSPCSWIYPHPQMFSRLWDSSFQSLYLTLKERKCNMFYVCAPEFVVLLLFVEEIKAYISNAKKELRHSLIKQVRDPLKEIETESSSSNSVLVFSGDEVDSLAEFLIKYRSSWACTKDADGPFLCSPIPFSNATHFAPKITCEDGIARFASPGDPRHENLCSTISISGPFLPVWIVSRLCALLVSKGNNFVARFETEGKSVGLNAALNAIYEDVDSKRLPEISRNFGFPEGTVEQCFDSWYLDGIEYSEGSYTIVPCPGP